MLQVMQKVHCKLSTYRPCQKKTCYFGIRPGKTYISLHSYNKRGGAGYSVPTLIIYDPLHEKTNVLVSDLVRHKQGCTATEDG